MKLKCNTFDGCKEFFFHSISSSMFQNVAQNDSIPTSKERNLGISNNSSSQVVFRNPLKRSHKFFSNK